MAGPYESARKAAAAAVGFEKFVVLVGILREQEAAGGMYGIRVQYHVNLCNSVVEHLQR